MSDAHGDHVGLDDGSGGEQSPSDSWDAQSDAGYGYSDDMENPLPFAGISDEDLVDLIRGQGLHAAIEQGFIPDEYLEIVEDDNY